MKNRKYMFDRRFFLKGVAGLTFALPFLEGIQGKLAYAAGNETPRYFVAVKGGNGVQQVFGANEPERFWPHDKGQLSAETMLREKDGQVRAISELAEHAKDLLIVSGTRFNFPGNGCAHSGGGNQCLTATPPSQTPDRNRSLATGESLDNFIQRTLRPDDPSPLVLIAGKASDYLDEVTSYKRPLDGQINGRLQSADRNPWEVYKYIFGIPGQDNNGMLDNHLVKQRKSINDLVREQLDRLKKSTSLSQSDLQRLDLHQQSIRDLEVKMLDCHLPETRWKEIKEEGPKYADETKVKDITLMMMDIIALAFACDLKRSATLQLGNGNDHSVYEDVSPYPFHWISHRIKGNGAAGSAASIEDATLLHHQIDRHQLKNFKYLIERLKEYSTGQGTLLDSSVAMWTNDLGTGGHSVQNIPYIIAGSGNGYLKTGQYIDARDTGAANASGWVSHSQVFNTIANAVGVGEVLGSPVSDFGHKGGQGYDKIKGGELPGMKA